MIVKTALPKILPTTPEWVEISLVFRKPAGNVLIQEAWQYGPLAIHPTLPDEPPMIAVTHIKSLLAIMRVTDVDDASAAVEYLFSSCPDAWMNDEVEVVIKLIPAKIVTWIKKCMVAKKLLPIPSLEEVDNAEVTVKARTVTPPEKNTTGGTSILHAGLTLGSARR